MVRKVDKFNVAVLGSTGLVGQKFVSILGKHPWFEIKYLTATENKVGKKYSEAVQWYVEEPLPENVKDIDLIKNEQLLSNKDLDLVFSALPADVAEKIEPEFLKKGIHVVSNASNLRMESDIPLLNPEVNGDHVLLAKLQFKRGWRGYLLKVPNCTTSIMTLSLKPIIDSYGIREIFVTSLQAVSGAGIHGQSSMSIIGNVVPYIEKEEEKIENESRKILGRVDNSTLSLSDLTVYATSTRVPVLFGHMVSVFAKLKEVPSDVADVEKAMLEFRGNKLKNKELPSKPDMPLVLRKEKDRPQPRLDYSTGNGMSVTVGRIRLDTKSGIIRYVAVGDNISRGAAGNGVLIGELLINSIRRGELD